MCGERVPMCLEFRFVAFMVMDPALVVFCFIYLFLKSSSWESTTAHIVEQLKPSKDTETALVLHCLIVWSNYRLFHRAAQTPAAKVAPRRENALCPTPTPSFSCSTTVKHCPQQSL
jgi:hypothetical protein